MKIGFDAKRAYTNAAGLGNFSRNCITALSGQYIDNQYFLFHPENKKPLFSTPENGVEIKPEQFWWRNLSNAWRSFQITKLAKKLELDVYHGLSHELPVGIEKTGVKTIVTIHDLIYIRYSEFFKRIDRNIYDRKFRHACRVADRIHAISEQTKQDLMTYFSVPEEKIEVVYQSVNPLFFQEKSEVELLNIRNKYQLPEKFILNVGTVEPRKNLLALLKGMVSSGIKIPLVVVGKPTKYQKKAVEFVAANGSVLDVRFLSGIQDKELAILYQLAEIMVYPSLFEGFGLPVAEAQASGCPVITSNTSSLPEAGGDAAIYINPENPVEIGEALNRFFSGEINRAELVEKGKLNAQRFVPEKLAGQLMQIYNSVLND